MLAVAGLQTSLVETSVLKKRCRVLTSRRCYKPTPELAQRPPASDTESKYLSGIQASAGSTMAFRLYSSQEGLFGEMPAHGLRIQAVPMKAAVTRRLCTSMQNFFSSVKLADGSSESAKQKTQQNKFLGSLMVLRRLITPHRNRPSPKVTKLSGVFSGAHVM